MLKLPRYHIRLAFFLDSYYIRLACFSVENFTYHTFNVFSS